MSNDTLQTTVSNTLQPEVISLENRLAITDDGLRHTYLARLSEMTIAPLEDLPPLEDDLISNIRLYHVREMVYRKGESVTDKFTTVFNTLSTYSASVFVLIDSDGREAKYYLGVRNNEPDNSPMKRSTVTLGDTLSQTLIGHFPGVRIEHVDRQHIARLSQKIERLNNVASVSVVGNNKSSGERSNEQFVQGILPLSFDHGIEAADGVRLQAGHRSALVQNEDQLCQILFH